MKLQRQMVHWEPSVIHYRPDYVWPWSTWIGLKKGVEAKEPHNMTLLMAHAYMKKPIVCNWKVEKVDADPREALGPKDFLFRKYVKKHPIAKNVKQTEKPRFILPRFRNVAAKVDDKWEHWPLDLPPYSCTLQRRNAIHPPEKDDEVGGQSENDKGVDCERNKLA
uniref:Centrosomal protein of 97 kDa n=1 Tax=Lygus hesperus TaxID=30085 RepID=A0A0A9YJV3_LYGHE